MKGRKQTAAIPEDFKKIARELLSASEQYEDQRARKPDLLKGLAAMSGLEDLARESLPKKQTKPAPETTPPPVKPKAVKKEIVYNCSNQTYSGALKDPSLIKALLNLSGKAPTPAPAPVAQSKVKAAAAAAVAAAPNPPSAPATPEKAPPSPADFKLGRLSRVEAEPKVAPISRSTSLRRCTVLKPGSSK
jgi:hypothetical protein